MPRSFCWACCSGYVTEGNQFVRRFLDLTRTEHTCGIAVEQQAQQKLRGIGLTTYWRIACVDDTHIQQRNHLHDETRQMVGSQDLSYGHSLIKRFFIVNHFESADHRYRSLLSACRNHSPPET